MYRQISIAEAKAIMAAEEVTLVDIRDINAYQRGHIEQAEHLTAENFGEICDNADKDKPLLVYCYHGISSQTAAACLVDEGFAKVYSIIGGFAAWQTANLSRKCN